MPKKFGRQIGDICGVCKTGKLRPELSPIFGELPLSGSMRMAGNRLVIGSLTCDNGECGITHAAADRGLTIAAVRERQLSNFVNQGDEPENCCACNHRLETAAGLGDGTANVEYLFCPKCGLPGIGMVVWIRTIAGRHSVADVVRRARGRR